MRTYEQIMAELPAARRAKIEGRARQLIAEEMALRQLRKARKLTQQQMAKILKIGQDGVSRLERRSDLLLSTLQSYVEAMGGQLRIIAEFKEGAVAISGLGIDETPKPERNSTRLSRHKRNLEPAHNASR